MEELEEVKRRKHLRELYWSNAHKALKEKEYEKASEFVWGSLIQLLQGLAWIKGVPIQSHGKTRNFVKELARALHSEEIWRAFEEGEKLHANFYRSFLEPYQIALSMEVVRRGMEELLKRAGVRL
jgi:hypothetical protein